MKKLYKVMFHANLDPKMIAGDTMTEVLEALPVIFYREAHQFNYQHQRNRHGGNRQGRTISSSSRQDEPGKNRLLVCR